VTCREEQNAIKIDSATIKGKEGARIQGTTTPIGKTEEGKEAGG